MVYLKNRDIENSVGARELGQRDVLLLGVVG